MNKTCRTCKESKSVDLFYRNKSKADGLHTECADCHLYRVNAYRIANLAKIQAQAAARQRRYRTYIPKKPATGEAKQKDKARQAFNRAVQNGKIVRQPCAECGKPNAQGHHSDYTKPFDVSWLCLQCHWKRHRKLDYSEYR